MTTPIRVEYDVHFNRRGRGSRKVLVKGPKPARPTRGRVPHVARLMALAIKCDGLIRGGVIANHAELARLGHVTRARVAQIMGLLALASDIQEGILFLPRTERGRHPIILRNVLPIAAVLDWQKQRRLWTKLTSVKPMEPGSVIDRSTEYRSR